ncbi:hypothetical protein D9M71_85980 [compost metagenome]
MAGIDGFAGEHHLHGQGLADRAQQALGAAGAGHDPEVDLRLAEAGVFAGDEDVGVHGQFAAAAQAEAIDGGDQRLAEAGDALPVGQARVIEDADQVALGHFLDIGAGGEGLAAAGDDHDAGFGVLLGGIQFGGQFTQQLGIERVERFRALQGDQADTLLGRQDSKGTRHFDASSGARAACGEPLLLVDSGGVRSCVCRAEGGATLAGV